MRAESEAPDPAGRAAEDPDSATNEAASADGTDVNATPTRYWVRVHGYPSSLESEVVYYADFYDPTVGRLPSDPRHNLRVGDTLIYYADGPSSFYGIGTIVGDVEGPLPDTRRGQRWIVPIKREAIIRLVSKAPHAVWLEPPSGWHFLHAARDFTYIRVPDEDGRYYAEQVRSRASTREA